MEKNVYKCLPDDAVRRKKKVSVFDEGTAAKLSAHLDLPESKKKLDFSKALYEKNY